MATIVVSGALANKPGNSGEAWVRMSWARGFTRLGFDVWFVEQIARGVLDDPETNGRSSRSSRHVEFFRSVTRRFGIEQQSALLDEKGQAILGPDPSTLEEVADEAALLVNISGNLSSRPLFDRFRKKVYVDLDPGFTQFWQRSTPDGARLGGHDYHFTVGLNLGKPGCQVPINGIRWRALPPLVVLNDWSVRNGDRNRLTTIGAWRGSFGRIQHEGRTYGLKAHEFRKFIDLPSRVPQTLEIALNIHAADKDDLNDLQKNGWRIKDPQEVVPAPDAYRTYIRESGGEFSVAQGIYVDTWCGWFSDRTVQYLASGKPALIQDTGFSEVIPAGEGLIPFRTISQAVAGANLIFEDYEHHCRAARLLAEEFFHSDRVLGALLEAVDVAS